MLSARSWMFTCRRISIGPSESPVAGMICMTPIAPADETADWFQPLSHQPSPITRYGFTRCLTADA